MFFNTNRDQIEDEVEQESKNQAANKLLTSNTASLASLKSFHLAFEALKLNLKQLLLDDFFRRLSVGFFNFVRLLLLLDTLLLC